MSLSVFFSWDTPGHPFAGSVPSYDGIADEADPLLEKPAAAEQWAARRLLDPGISGWRREALEQFLYVLLRRPDGATRLIEEDRDFEGIREPTLLERSEQVAKRFTKLPRAQKAREHLLLDFEYLFRSTADDPERNDKLAILCELLLNHPAADALKPPKKRSQRKVR
jgi:hypothetical protein